MKKITSILLIKLLFFSQLYAEEKISNIQTSSEVNKDSREKSTQSINIINDANVTKPDVETVQNEGFTAKKALVYAGMPVYVAGAIVYYVVLTVVVAPIWLVQKAFGINQNNNATN